MSRIQRPSALRRARLHASTARRTVRRYGLRLGNAFARLDERLVFVVGSPRSGTSFTASALGQVPGLVDLGEINRLKAGIPGLYRAVADGGATAGVVAEIRGIMRTSQRLALTAGARAIEQTPESSFLVTEIAAAFPEAVFVHLVRDGRDVAASLLERGWLSGGTGARSADGNTADDAGQPFGGYARFWVEPGREAEFESASEISRCAWAWRRYESAARTALGAIDPARCIEIRYEGLAERPQEAADRLAAGLGISEHRDAFRMALGGMHDRSVGRHRNVLSAEQLAAVEAEAGSLLTTLGYR